MPRMRDESFGTGDQTWCASPEVFYETRTETLDISAFTGATHFPNGYIPSGTPLAKVAGLMVPYDSTEATTTNAGILAGFLATDQVVSGNAATNDFGIPVVDHGRIKSAKVPAGATAFTAPVAAAKRAAALFIFI